SVTDRDDEKEIAALVRVWPFRNSGNLLQNIRLGVGASVGSVDDLASGGLDLVSTELSIMWWESGAAAPAFDGRRTRIVPQIQVPIGPLNLQAEYLIREDEFADGGPESELETSGFYVQASYILTGEDKKPENRIVPKGDWGAVELAVRFARVTVENGVDAGLGAAVGNAEEMTSTTFGVNWWPVRMVRFSANVVVERYDEELFFDTREEDALVGFLLRGQVDF
ncbi:MAG TPA: porin, partial [Planctomycetota bacterium]|nr:porin [Planctomycetota bacterium]